jgi:predicted ABC-type transport system involved in lysophospholipase L1 biosynthesis ATPase subunit
MSNVMLEFDRVEKAYGGLRPLRIRELTLSRGQKLALLGFDRAMAEVFVDLATGATLPESGEVRAFGQHTAAIADAEAWLATLDRFGIVSERAVLLDALTALQNVAMPLTLEVEPLAESIRVEVTRVAAEAGIEGLLERSVRRRGCASGWAAPWRRTRSCCSRSTPMPCCRSMTYRRSRPTSRRSSKPAASPASR